MTPFRSKEEQAAAMGKRKPTAAPPRRVPLSKANKGEPIPIELLGRELKLGLNKVSGELFDLAVNQAYRILRDVPRHALRVGSEVAVYRLAQALTQEEGVPAERAHFLAVQAVKAAKKADCFTALRDATEQVEPAWPSKRYELGFQTATESLHTTISTGAGVDEAITKLRSRDEKDGRDPSDDFTKGGEAAYAALKKAYDAAGLATPKNRRGA